MTFNLWLYFLEDWELDADGVLQPPAPALPPRTSAGSGGRHYDRMPQDYWDMRAQAMARPPAQPKGDWLVPKPPQRRIVMPDTSPPRRPPPAPAPKVLSPSERGQYLSAMKDAGSLDALKAMSRKLSRFSP